MRSSSTKHSSSTMHSSSTKRKNNSKLKRHNKSVKKGGKHTYATISHYNSTDHFRKSTKRNLSPVYAKIIKKIKKSTSPMLRTLRLKNKVRN
jgi:hypothetical protein